MPKQCEAKSFLLHRLQHFFPSPLVTFLALLFGSICITGLVYLVTTTQILQVGRQILHTPSILLLNILPVFLLSILLFLLSRRMPFALSTVGILFVFFAIVDRVKVTMRQEPLLPTDLTLIKEALAILKTFPIHQLLLVGLLLLFFAALLFLSFQKSSPVNLSPYIRIGGLTAVLICALGANHLYYVDKTLYDGYPTLGNPYFQVNQYNSKGMIYSFFHQYNITKITAPTDYDPTFFATQENIDWTPPVGESYPHIIMIMGEAFSDLSENAHLDFSTHRDPLQNWKNICAEENAINGHIIVPNFGGGTSNTEYDVLTGCSTYYLDNPLPSYSFIHNDFDGLPRQLTKLGYETLAIHPGYAWFYNRQNVYPDLGFETCYFLEDSFNLETQGYGGYINETATMDKIISTLDAHIQEKDSPLFSFTVTIQNHGPYEKHYGTLPPNFSTDVSLDENQTDLLTQYFAGIIDADTQLERLKEYAAQSDEPIVLVYFGDHLPGFSNGMEFFDLLDYPIDANGSPQEQLAIYKTPYLIWQNDSATALFGDLKEKASAIHLPENGLISAQFLGTTLLELYASGHESPLHRYNASLRRELPVCNKNIYVDAAGNYTEYVSTAQQEMLQIMKNWQYYKLFDENTP